MEQYELGLVSVSFRKHTPEEILSQMKKAGLTCIEWGSDVHAPKDDRENLLRLKQMQEFYRITCCSYGTYFRLGVTPLEELPGYIAAAKILGTSILRLWCGDKNACEYGDEEWKTLLNVCMEAARIAQEEQVILCMECHNHTFTNTKESALELMKAVDSPYFRMYWQPNQFRTVEENLAYAELLADYTKHLHVFHWKGEEKLPLGEAIPTWKSYINRFHGAHTLLLEFMPDGRLESLEEEAKALAEIVGER